MSKILTAKILEGVFILLFFYLIESAKADINMLVENETPTGGDVKRSEYITTSSDAMGVAKSNCESKGLGGVSRLSLLGLPKIHWEFECDRKKPIQIEPMSSKKYYEYKAINDEKAKSESNKLSTSSYQSNNSIQEAKKKCESLGFKPKTDKFGNCVLELTK